MGYGNGVVDWGAADTTGAAGGEIGALMALRRTRDRLEDTENKLLAVAKNLHYEKTLRIAFRDAVRQMRNNNEITEEEFQEKFMGRVQRYKNFVEEYGYEKFVERIIADDKEGLLKPILP